MESRFTGFSDSRNGIKFVDQTIFPNSDQYPNFANTLAYKFNDPTLDHNYIDVPFVQTGSIPGHHSFPLSNSGLDGGDFSSDDSDASEAVLKYISQMLMEEEDMEEKPCMFPDPLALQAAEKSLYDALGKKYPQSPNQSTLSSNHNVESPDDGFSGSFSSDYSNGSSGSTTSGSVDLKWNGDFVDSKPSILQMPIPVNFVFRSSAKPGSQVGFNFQNGFVNGNGLAGSSVSESLLQFQRGVEEASKFLPKGNQLLIDLENNALPTRSKERDLKIVVKAEREERESSPNGFQGKKNHVREDEDFEEERSNKQSAVYVDESELSELFDKVLLCGGRKEPVCMLDEAQQNEPSKTLQLNEQSNGSNGGKSRAKKQGNKKEVVDLRTLLILCAQAAAVDDRRTASELLKQIRQHSSSFGDGCQRLAHCFANGLEARMAGTGTQIYAALSDKRTSAVDMLKAFQVYISVSPFKKVAIMFANHNIFKAAEKSKTLHIIDFGILYGFQWPALIHRLSLRPGGPPKLRITGIELPQRGFRPAEKVQESGRRLAKYCERFNVPFEYNAIALKWENIQIDDLKINPNEFLAVNCLYRFKNLLDETVVVNSPRNAVLSLIRKIKPGIFIQAIVNGSFNAPFFITRFREALFHYSALFDMLDATLPREDQMRLMFESEFFGREVMNVIACEGSERVERPETYKQWQVRNKRIGFKQLPLDPEVVKKLRDKVKTGYHNDFTVDEDGHWMLQGWKGRIMFGSSAWVPV